MMERPILFSTEMVRAILAGQKNQTRRVIKIQPDDVGAIKLTQGWQGDGHRWYFTSNSGKVGIFKPLFIKCPYGQVGDLLWVKEAWFNPNYERGEFRSPYLTLYKALEPDVTWGDFKWKSARFIPKVYARIWLEITGVRAERLQDISEEDAKSEGCMAWFPPYEIYPGCKEEYNERGGSYRNGFHDLWQQINEKKNPWLGNPYVWVVEFKRIER